MSQTPSDPRTRPRAQGAALLWDGESGPSAMSRRARLNWMFPGAAGSRRRKSKIPVFPGLDPVEKPAQETGDCAGFVVARRE